VAPLQFDRPAELIEAMRGAATLYNTYWVRFPRGNVTFEKAVANTRVLVRAAREAGIKHIVHLSITNPSANSTLGYFRGKAAVEQMIMDSGLASAIVRPTVIFGTEDILISNVAWLLRRFPVFVVPGSGAYRLQPVFVEDVAELAVDGNVAGANRVFDAVGPEIYTFQDLVQLIAKTVGSHARLVPAPASLALLMSQLVGLLVRDVVLTNDRSADSWRDCLSQAACQPAELD
jgi:NADH dehydrogenase